MESQWIKSMTADQKGDFWQSKSGKRLFACLAVIRVLADRIRPRFFSRLLTALFLLWATYIAAQSLAYYYFMDVAGRLIAAGHFVGAKDVMDLALTEAKKYSSDDIRYKNCLERMADLSLSLCDFDGAEKYYDELAGHNANRRIVYGERHAKILYQSAAVAYRKGDYDQCKRLLLQCLFMRERKASANPGDLARTLYSLGRVYLKEGQPHIAESYFVRALEAFEKAPRSFSYMYADCLKEYANALQLMKKTVEANRLLALSGQVVAGPPEFSGKDISEFACIVTWQLLEACAGRLRAEAQGHLKEMTSSVAINQLRAAGVLSHASGHPLHPAHTKSEQRRLRSVSFQITEPEAPDARGFVPYDIAGIMKISYEGQTGKSFFRFQYLIGVNKKTGKLILVSVKPIIAPSAALLWQE